MIVREELVAPGRRRLMMRRALQKIVPQEVLERRRKAFATRSPILALGLSQDAIDDVLRNSSIAERGLIDFNAFRHALKLTQESTYHSWWPQIMQTILFALWLADFDGGRQAGTTAST